MGRCPAAQLDGRLWKTADLRQVFAFQNRRGRVARAPSRRLVGRRTWKRVVPSCPSCLPHPHLKGSCPRSGFLGFHCRHPSRLPGVRVCAAAFGYSPHASLPRSSWWGATGKSHLPDVGGSFACFPLSLCVLYGWNPSRFPPTILSSLSCLSFPPLPQSHSLPAAGRSCPSGTLKELSRVVQVVSSNLKIGQSGPERELRLFLYSNMSFFLHLLYGLYYYTAHIQGEDNHATTIQK